MVVSSINSKKSTVEKQLSDRPNMSSRVEFCMKIDNVIKLQYLKFARNVVVELPS
jgi:hypothetical protein